MRAVIAVLMMGVAVAHAQPTDPAKAKAAKEYVDAGLAAQNAKDYDTAVTLYQKAYDLIPHPVLLFNLGQAHRLAGRLDVALGFYEKYLAAEPKGTQAPTARDFVAEIKAKKAAEAKKLEDAKRADDARKSEEARKAEAARAAEAERRRQAEAARVAEAQRRADEEQRADARDAPGRGLRIGGIVAGGAGVVSIGAAIYFGMRARSISDDLSKPGAVFDPDRFDEGEAAERNAIITGIAGGLLVAGGVAMYYVGHRKRQTAVTALVQPNALGVAITFQTD